MRVCVAALVVVVAIAAACSPEGNAAPFIAGTSSGTCLAAFRVAPPSATRHPGDTLRLQAVAVCAVDFDPTQIRWSSGDTLIAQVDSLTGLVMARARGNVTVTGVEVADRTVRGAMALAVVP